MSPGADPGRRDEDRDVRRDADRDVRPDEDRDIRRDADDARRPGPEPGEPAAAGPDAPAPAGPDAETDPRVLELLDAVGRAERDDLEAARDVDAPPGRAEHALAAGMAAGVTPPSRPGARSADGGPTGEPRSRPAAAADARPTGRSPGGRRLLWAAAAALLAALVLRQLASEPDADPGAILGEDVRAVAPRGPVEAFVPFRFEADLTGGRWAVVTVWQDSPDGPAVRLARSDRLRAAQWTPDVDTSGWTSIRWTVALYHGANAPRLLAEDEARAERSR